MPLKVAALLASGAGVHDSVVLCYEFLLSEKIKVHVPQFLAIVGVFGVLAFHVYFLHVHPDMRRSGCHASCARTDPCASIIPADTLPRVTPIPTWSFDILNAWPIDRIGTLTSLIPER